MEYYRPGVFEQERTFFPVVIPTVDLKVFSGFDGAIFRAKKLYGQGSSLRLGTMFICFEDRQETIVGKTRRFGEIQGFQN